MKILNFFRKILAFVFSILLFLIFLVVMSLYSVKGMISGKNLSNYVKDAEILNIDINILFDELEPGVTLKEKIEEIALESSIPQEITQDILNSEEINNFLGDFFNKTILYVINGGEKPVVSKEAINEMILVARISLNEHINIMLEKSELDDYINDYSNKLSNLIPNREEIVGDIPINIISNIMNFNFVYIYLIIVLIVLFLILDLHSFYKTLKYVSIPMILSGVIFVIIGSSSEFISNYLLYNINSLKLIIDPLIINFLTIVFKCGIFMSFTGIFLIVIYSVIKRIVITDKKENLEITKRINIEDIKIK